MTPMKMLARKVKIALAAGFVIALANSIPPAAFAAEGKHFNVAR